MNTKLLRQTYTWLLQRIEQKNDLRSCHAQVSGNTSSGYIDFTVAFACITLMRALHPYLHNGFGNRMERSLWKSFAVKDFDLSRYLGEPLKIGMVHFNTKLTEDASKIPYDQVDILFERFAYEEISALLKDFKEYLLNHLDKIEATKLE